MKKYIVPIVIAGIIVVSGSILILPRFLLPFLMHTYGDRISVVVEDVGAVHIGAHHAQVYDLVANIGDVVHLESKHIQVNYLPRSLMRVPRIFDITMETCRIAPKKKKIFFLGDVAIDMTRIAGRMDIDAHNDIHIENGNATSSYGTIQFNGTIFSNNTLNVTFNCFIFSDFFTIFSVPVMQVFSGTEDDMRVVITLTGECSAPDIAVKSDYFHFILKGKK